MFYHTAPKRASAICATLDILNIGSEPTIDAIKALRAQQTANDLAEDFEDPQDSPDRTP